MSDYKSGAKTLLWSIIMSSPGPLVMGLALIGGHTSTQIADFMRRTAEFLAIVMSYFVYTATRKDGVCDEEKRIRLERRSNLFVGSMMALAGTIMVVLSLTIHIEDKGTVIPGLAIAALGVVANSIFWVRYTRLNWREPNVIFAVQARLYRAKILVDSSVIIALTTVLVAPKSPLSYWFDLVGSLIVALYLAWCGIRTVYEEHKKLKNETL